jgi:hypothetical protein
MKKPTTKFNKNEKSKNNSPKDGTIDTLRNRLQTTFQKENDSSQASAVFSAQNAQVKNCACLKYIIAHEESECP